MIEGYYFQSMRINEKSTFARNVLAATEGLAATDAEFKALCDEVKLQNEVMDKATIKLSVADLTELMNEDDELRESGLANLKNQAQICAQRKNAEVAQAGKLVISTIKSVDWNLQQRGNTEESALLVKLLTLLDTPSVKQAVTLIDGEEFVEEMRTGQTQYLAHDQQRSSTKGQSDKSNAKEVSRELGLALDKLFRYINFMIEFKSNAAYQALGNDINAIVTQMRAIVKSRAPHTESKTPTAAAK